MIIEPGDLDEPRIVALLRTHLERAHAVTPKQSCHAFDVSGLKSPAVSFWAGWENGELACIGALRRLSPEHAEVKSMHTPEALRGRGYGAAMLRHLIATARARGYRRLSLETGAMDYFRPARDLYARHGFTACGPFADYKVDSNSVYMTLAL
jgi:putative acetyltransferase